jgi:hypothetical protein
MADQIYMAGAGRAFAVLGFAKTAAPVPNFKEQAAKFVKEKAAPVASEIAHGVVPGAIAGVGVYNDPLLEDHPTAQKVFAGVYGLGTGALGFGAKRYLNDLRRQEIDFLRGRSRPVKTDFTNLSPQVQEALNNARKNAPNLKKMQAYLHPDNARRVGMDPAVAEEAFKFVNNPKHVGHFFDDVAGVGEHAAMGHKQKAEFAANQAKIDQLYKEMRGFM